MSLDDVLAENKRLRGEVLRLEALVTKLKKAMADAATLLMLSYSERGTR